MELTALKRYSQCVSLRQGLKASRGRRLNPKVGSSSLSPLPTASSTYELEPHLLRPICSDFVQLPLGVPGEVVHGALQGLDLGVRVVVRHVRAGVSHQVAPRDLVRARVLQPGGERVAQVVEGQVMDRSQLAGSRERPFDFQQAPAGAFVEEDVLIHGLV